MAAAEWGFYAMIEVIGFAERSAPAFPANRYESRSHSLFAPFAPFYGQSPSPAFEIPRFAIAFAPAMA